MQKLRAIGDWDWLLASLNLWPGKSWGWYSPVGGLGGTGVAGDRAYRIPGLVPIYLWAMPASGVTEYGLGCLKEVGFGTQEILKLVQASGRQGLVPGKLVTGNRGLEAGVDLLMSRARFWTHWGTVLGLRTTG